MVILQLLVATTINISTVLMFVFWYCHKRGKEVRLAREQAEGASKEGGEELEVDASDTADESELEEMAEELEKAGSNAQGVAGGDAQDDSLDRKTAVCALGGTIQRYLSAPLKSP